MFEIKHRFTKSTLFACDAENMRDAIALAIKSGANLSGANLSRADLFGADLSGADLSGVDLFGANLSRVDLSGTRYGDAMMERGLIQIVGLRWPVLIFDAHKVEGE